MGWDAGYLPADALEGYRRLRASLQDEPIEPPAAPPDPYDTHPPMSERIAAVRSMGAAGTVRVADAHAIGLLRDPAALLDAALLDGLPPGARTRRRADWPALVGIAGVASLTESTAQVLASAARVTGRPASLGTLLDALDAGLLVEIGADSTSPGFSTDGPRVRRERARLLVHKGLLGAVVAALTDLGALRWRESWPSLGAMRLDERLQGPLPELIDAAVADPPNTSRLRALLDSAQESEEGRRHHGTAH
jgi:hypothetical protein